MRPPKHSDHLADLVFALLLVSVTLSGLIIVMLLCVVLFDQA